MRKGYILRFVGSTRYFQTLIRSNLTYVSDKNYAWFTEKLDTACEMLIDLYNDGYTCTIEEYSH